VFRSAGARVIITPLMAPRALAVVVQAVFVDNGLEVALVDRDQVLEALLAGGPHPKQLMARSSGPLASAACSVTIAGCRKPHDEIFEPNTFYEGDIAISRYGFSLQSIVTLSIEARRHCHFPFQHSRGRPHRLLSDS